MEARTKCVVCGSPVFKLKDGEDFTLYKADLECFICGHEVLMGVLLKLDGVECWNCKTDVFKPSVGGWAECINCSQMTQLDIY